MGPLELLRVALVVGAISACLFYGIAVLVLSRDRRRAANQMLALWVSLGSFLSGIRLEIQGEEHLEAARPAVFLFNHQSAADILILSMLLRRDFTGVAKKEIRSNPVLGPAFALAGAVFLDRFHHERAVASLQPAVDALRRGISIGYAPEGTRSETASVGPFKKGGFRLAMDAGVAVVPIVIRNACDALPARSLSLRPATVDVVVFAPIPTRDWALERLDVEIAAVRRIYTETLENWPGGAAARP